MNRADAIPESYRHVWATLQQELFGWSNDEAVQWSLEKWAGFAAEYPQEFLREQPSWYLVGLIEARLLHRKLGIRERIRFSNEIQDAVEGRHVDWWKGDFDPIDAASQVRSVVSRWGRYRPGN